MKGFGKFLFLGLDLRNQALVHHQHQAVSENNEQDLIRDQDKRFKGTGMEIILCRGRPSEKSDYPNDTRQAVSPKNHSYPKC